MRQEYCSVRGLQTKTILTAIIKFTHSFTLKIFARHSVCFGVENVDIKRMMMNENVS